MDVISTSAGFVLQFDTLEDLESTVLHLTEQIAYIKANTVAPPHLYMIGEDPKLMDDVLIKIKPDLAEVRHTIY